MDQWQEKLERERRAERLRDAQKNSALGGYRKLSTRFGWNENTVKGHLQGKSSFGTAMGKQYAKAFGVSFQWLYHGIGQPEDVDSEPVSIVDVPLISLISAGQLAGHDGVTDFSDYPTVSALDLPDGDWIALRVEGDSMNKISPPDSIIFANRRDKRLVHNACYVIADEQGNATYKRYRNDQDPPFQPASYLDMPPPVLVGTITVIGRVRRSIIEM